MILSNKNHKRNKNRSWGIDRKNTKIVQEIRVYISKPLADMFILSIQKGYFPDSLRLLKSLLFIKVLFRSK